MLESHWSLQSHPAPQSHPCQFAEGEIMIGGLTPEATEVGATGPVAWALD